jgi:uncharacterized glyoxalase superfamily protein PhnB
MLDAAADPGQDPRQAGLRHQSLAAFVSDLDARYRNAKSAGATIVAHLHETECGERRYSARDLDGHHWLFSTHTRDVSPS